MKDLITLLQETRVNTVLVVGGILFLLLAIGAKTKFITGKVNRKIAGCIGFVMLSAGLAISLPVPPLPPPTPTVSPTLTNTATPTEIPVTSTNTPTSPVALTPTLTATLPPFSFCQDKGMGDVETVPVNPPRSVKGIIVDLKTRHAFKNGEKYGFSLWEVVINGPDTADNLAIGATAHASSEQDTKDCIKCLAPKAIDGDNNSRWSSEFYEPQSLRIDFSTPQVIQTIILKWQDAYAEAYCITEIK